MNNIRFLGFGAWGGALAIHIARHGAKHIRAWEYLPSIRDSISTNKTHPHLGPSAKVPGAIKVVSEFKDLHLSKESVLFIAVASNYITLTLKHLRSYIVKKHNARFRLKAAVIMTKGISKDTHDFSSSIVKRELRMPENNIFVLTGPTIAKELLAGDPTEAVLAGKNMKLGGAISKTLTRGNLFVHQTSDIIGPQIGGAMKNIYAVGFGYLEAKNAAANHKALYLSKALREMETVSLKLGGRTETICGPAGLGDLLTTSFSPNSRNSSLGRMLAKGYSVKQITKKIGMATEGIDAVIAFKSLERKLKIRLPLLTQVHKLIKNPLKRSKLMLS
ncbi:NAD(P)H-dependent glycerol-3-phosphate dehydrogenase [Elusimicrobiota bacterium]